MTAEPERHPTADASDREAVIELLARILARHWLATHPAALPHSPPEQATRAEEKPTHAAS
jgi:hypothetical protein